MLDVITLFLFSIIVYNIPLLYGTTGEIMIEKSGSLNLGVEGTMAIGAVAGYLLGMRSGSLLVAVLISFIASGLVGLVFAFLTVTLQANQNVTGLTITTFGVAYITSSETLFQTVHQSGPRSEAAASTSSLLLLRYRSFQRSP